MRRDIGGRFVAGAALGLVLAGCGDEGTTPWIDVPGTDQPGSVETLGGEEATLPEDAADRTDNAVSQDSPRVEDEGGLAEAVAADEGGDPGTGDPGIPDPGATDPGPVDPGTTDPGTEVTEPEKFSFFVTSLRAMQDLSGSANGFGGDLRFGETGAGAGLRGADKICATIAERSMPGASAKVWRAFLSATDDGNGNVVNAIDRIGEGPWYDRLGRVFALRKADLLYDRPSSADATIKNDFPNEDGVPNHRPILTQPQVDNHDFLTGTNAQGRLYGSTATCKDWTSVATNVGKPRVGHSWPRSGGGGPGGGPGDQDMANWMSALDEAGCKAGINLVDNGAGDPGSGTVGAGGGYGGIYCFALTP